MNLLLILLYPIVFQFQAGDLLFQDCDCGPICDAIENVTESRDAHRFSHIGMVVSIDDTLKVIEANVGGVKIVPLYKFIYRYTDSYGNPTIAVGRLGEAYRQYIQPASTYVLTKLGYEYDDVFLMNNGKYYCSELIYEGFSRASNDSSFFTLRPMTFKNLKTGQWESEFVDYYNSIHTEIPEGKLGLNPGSISLDPKLTLYYLY